MVFQNPLEKVFAGNKGVVNTLFNILGYEATIETITRREYNEEKDAYFEDVARQILPFLVEDMTGNLKAAQVPEAVSAGLIETETVFTGSVAATNLHIPPLPLKTNVLFRGEKFQVIAVKPQYVGGIVHSYQLTMRKR